MVSLPGVHPFFGDHILIRVAGIDTPEIKGKCEREILLAKEARNFLREMLGKVHSIQLIKARRDKYFRINARVFADGIDISEFMINKGYAVRYDGGTKTTDWCRNVESSEPSEKDTRSDASAEEPK
jgi:endonuclease YncB( thermonuclease family)